MSTITEILNRQPELSYLPPQHFYMVFEKLPQIVFNCQQLQIPSVSSGEVALENRFNGTSTFIPGNNFDYANLDVTFLLEKNLRNYSTVMNWMKAQAQPENFNQMKEWVDEQRTTDRNDFHKLMSNASVFATDAGNDILFEWRFVGCFPVSLDGPSFDASLQDQEYLTSVVTLRYNYFTIHQYDNGRLVS